MSSKGYPSGNREFKRKRRAPRRVAVPEQPNENIVPAEGRKRVIIEIDDFARPALKRSVLSPVARDQRLFAVDPGIGKTEAMIRTVNTYSRRSDDVLWVVPTHQLPREIAAKLTVGTVLWLLVAGYFLFSGRTRGS